MTKNSSRRLIAWSVHRVRLGVLLAALALAEAQPCAAEPNGDLTPLFKVPQAGATTDESFITELPRQLEMPCVAIEVDNASILVSRNLLDRLARAPRLGPDWKSESERLAMIRADRARTLLGAASAASANDCAERVEEMGLRDARYLVMELLISGNAMVVDAKGGRILQRFRVQYTATGGVGGYVSFHLDRGPIFFRVVWWVS